MSKQTSDSLNVVVLTPLKRDGQRIPTGTRLPLPAAEAVSLLEVKAVRLAEEALAAPLGADAGAGDAGSTDDAGGGGGLVNINEATAEEIAAAASGINAAVAAELVQSREADGPFETLDDMTRVRGIGPATVERNREALTA